MSVVSVLGRSLDIFICFYITGLCDRDVHMVGVQKYATYKVKGMCFLDIKRAHVGV